MELKGIQNIVDNNGIYPAEKTKAAEKDTKSSDKSKSDSSIIQANDLNLISNQNNSIKELFAKKAALKMQLDQFEKDSKVDDNLKGHSDKMEALLKEADLNQNEVNRLEGLKKDLKDSYGIEDDSKEQKDLELLEKQALGKTLTQEEKDRIAAMGPLTEYQTASIDYTVMEAEFNNRASKATEGYFNEISTITSIKLELLKDDPMVDIRNGAQELLKKVDSEIQQNLIEEIKNRVNENLDIDPNKSILEDPKALVDQKKVTEEDLKGLAVDEKV